MSEVLRPIPEFEPDQFPQAVTTCLEIGVAKVSRLVTASTVQILNKRLNFYEEMTIEAELILDESEDLRAVRDYLFTEANLASGIKCDFMGLWLPATALRSYEDAHVDSNFGASHGLSVLLPVSGNKAVFTAGDSEYRFTWEMARGELGEEEGRIPDFIGEYGVADAMLVRQGLKTLNGTSVKIDQTYHCGASDSPREVASFDFHIPDFSDPAFTGL